ncbi:MULTISPECIES: YwiC-like family protein [unclassified Luteococcus]|uniref:YwiC-like family protein n=1 Tax=unclassified Luteococcus TaxID=2639923 RepID=UPI00313F3118
MASKAGWIPQQHGAWAMLVVPLVVGLVVRARDGLPGWALPLAATWLVGYFCFNACGLWLKAATRRRHNFLPAVLTYGGVSAVAGLATLALGGLPLLWWFPVYLPLLGTALWLTSRRHDRALLSGLCTVSAACLLAWILPFTTPQAVWRAGLTSTSWLAIGLFGYFFGTVFVVKTLIRERNKPGWVRASIGWHLAWVALSALVWRLGAASPWWAAFFAVGTVRAWALPWFGPRRGRNIRPGQVGMLEVLLSLAVLALCLTA